MYEYEVFFCHPAELKARLIHFASHGWKLIKIADVTVEETSSPSDDTQRYSHYTTDIMAVMERTKSANS